MIGKIITLPSNGLSYSKFIRVYPIRFGTMILLDKAFYNSNQSEYLEAILNEYTEGVNILEMYVGDAIYVHNYLLAMSMELREFGTKKQCPHCEEINLIKIEIGNFDIKWLGSDAQDVGRHEVGGVTFFFRRRKMKDNFITATELIKKDKIADLDYLIEFIIPQIIGISNSNKSLFVDGEGDKLTLEITREIFTHLQLKEKKKIYEAIMKMEEEFGYENKFVMTCRSCEQQSPFLMWDYKSFSVFVPIEEVNKAPQFENVINLVRSKAVRFSEFMEIPNIIVNDVVEGIQRALKDK